MYGYTEWLANCLVWRGIFLKAFAHQNKTAVERKDNAKNQSPFLPEALHVCNTEIIVLLSCLLLFWCVDSWCCQTSRLR